MNNGNGTLYCNMNNVVYVTILLVCMIGMGLCVATLECVLGMRLCVALLECSLITRVVLWPNVCNFEYTITF
jgi:hypothetical protein